MNVLQKLFWKIKCKLGFAAPGFTELYYRGKPVVLRDDMPINEIGFINKDTARVRLLNWKTGKKGKLMTFDQFEDWIVKENRRIKKLEKSKMKNYKWAKGYKYVKVPVFFKRFDFLGFTLIFSSHKTKKRRVGGKTTTDKIWGLYENLLTPNLVK